jgi:hypothetical protein
MTPHKHWGPDALLPSASENRLTLQGVSSQLAECDAGSSTRPLYLLPVTVDLQRKPLVYGTGHAFAFQISLAYSAIVRSLENLPELATFRMALRVQVS